MAIKRKVGAGPSSGFGGMDTSYEPYDPYWPEYGNAPVNMANGWSGKYPRAPHTSLGYEDYSASPKPPKSTPAPTSAPASASTPSAKPKGGLLDMIMSSEPKKSGIDQSDVLMAIGSGLLGLSGDSGLQGLGKAGFGQIAERRDRREAEAKLGEITNKTVAWLSNNERKDLAGAVGIGVLDPQEAIKLALSKSDLPARVQEAMFYMSNPEIANRMKELGFIGGSGSNVTVKNMGSIPPGYRVIYDDNQNPIRMEKIEGGAPAEAEAFRTAQGGNTANFVIDKVDRLENLIEKEQTWYDPIFGATGLIAQYIPSSNRVDAQNLVDTIIANIGFDKLNELRQASPTGGALGQVTELELRMLQRSISSLSLAQSQDQFLTNLAEVKGFYQQIMNKALAYPNAAEYGFIGKTSTGLPTGSPTLNDPLGLFK